MPGNEKILNELFGSAAKARLIKLFLWNPEESFGMSEAARRTRMPRFKTRRWLGKLASVGFIKVIKNAKTKNPPKKTAKKKSKRT